jgi:NAD+ synthase
MRLSPQLFEIDCTVVVPRIEAFIREKLQALSRKGILVPLSGGLDSSTVAALCARAVGRESVTGLMLPDLKGSPEAVRFGRLVARELGLRTRSINMTPILLAAGVYNFAANLVPSRRLLAAIVRRRLQEANRNMFLEVLRGSDEKMVLSAFASTYARQRARVVVTFRYADLHRLLVVGTAHKSEDLLGLFVKFGVDDCADLMPLKNLYRSHILQIAKYIRVPQSVLERTPNPEMLPGVEDKYFDLLGIPSEQVDLVLFGLESHMTGEEIAAETGVALAKVAEIGEIVRLSQHMRQPSMSLDPLAD